MIRKHSIGLRHAWDGLYHAVTTQPNFVIHLLVSGVVVGVGMWLKVSSLEWIVLALVIALGLVIELVNTAIESTVDVATQKWHPVAKIAKDTAAAAMLIYAIGASLVGLLIFIPRIILNFKF